MSLLVQRKKMLEIINSVIDSHSSLFIFEILSIAIGLAIVLNHNIWTGDGATIVVTAIGWIFLARGIVAMFLSYLTIHKIFKAFQKNVGTYYTTGVLLFFLSLYLIFAAIFA